MIQYESEIKEMSIFSMGNIKQSFLINPWFSVGDISVAVFLSAGKCLNIKIWIIWIICKHGEVPAYSTERKKAHYTRGL